MTGAASRLGDNWRAERERWVNWSPVLLGLGIAFYFGLANEPPTWLGWVWIPVAAVAIARRRGPGFVPVLAVALLLLGFAAALWRTQRVAAPVLARRIGPAAISGIVDDVLRGDADAARLVLSQPHIRGLAPELTPARLRVSLRSGVRAVHPGDRVRLLGVLLPPSAPTAPGAFDFARKAWFERLGGVGYAYGGATIEEAGAGGGAGRAIAGFRERLAARIRDRLPGDTGAVAAALMTGRRAAIAAPVVVALRSAGLAHLLAISGLHIGLVAGFVFFGLRALLALSERLTLGYPIKKWAALGAGVAAALYLIASGATIPTQRALVMTLIILLAIVTDRSAMTMRLVALAAFGILLITPESLLSVSFQMSFAAVVSLVAAYEFVRHRGAGGWLAMGPRSRRLVAYLAAVAFTTVVAELAIAPLAAFQFNRVVSYGLLANMVAVPIMALWVMPMAVVSFLLMPLGLEGPALGLMGFGIDGVIAVARTVSAWPGAVRLIPAFSGTAIALVVLGGLWLCLWARPWRLAGLAAIALGLLLAGTGRSPDILIDGDAKLFALRDPAGKLVLSSGRAARRVGRNWLRRAGQGAAAARPVPPVEPWGGLAGDQGAPWLACDSLGCIYRPSRWPAKDADRAHVVGSPHVVGTAQAVGSAQAVRSAQAWGPNSGLVAIISDPRAIAEDCAVARIVISLVPLRGPCPAAELVIDRFDLWRRGSHAIRLEPDGITLTTVGDTAGRRPWSVYPRSSRTRKRRQQGR